MRLTHKHKYKKDSQRFVFDMKDYRKACQKLGQLEDIEEELGIDLITLFKALKNGIWWKGITSFNTSGIFFEENPQLDIENKLLIKITFMKNQDYVYLKDYGKTWALTKEELEQQKKGVKNGKA